MNNYIHKINFNWILVVMENIERKISILKGWIEKVEYESWEFEKQVEWV